jgi:hypothetical protein
MSQQLYKAAKDGRLDEFRQLVQEHRELNGDELQRVLMFVFRFEHLNLVRYVLEECGLDSYFVWICVNITLDW